ncbi:MAG: DUF5916 domain-containing protein [Gammaproteobacteria bacterium]|nr:DUF5916 domain-containing protein [Gammaproteobacteria bacterium]MDP2141735.1 DUF5916 domain-containing protein [Gammaproteobacteria bacterium]MDP2347968.1 DUF5916 domain-containing protein [Gammaproteobacteria bacterium]
MSIDYRNALYCALLLVVPCSINAQPFDTGSKSLSRIAQSEVSIELDGNLTEAIWRQVTPFDDMLVIRPDTLAGTSLNTTVSIFYTERGIYVGVDNQQPPQTRVARMSSRDRDLERDAFVFAIDPSGTGLYGYLMQINLGDTLNDGTILPERQINLQWDGPWNARTAETDQGWSAEIFIPWSMMSLPEGGGDRTIGIYAERRIAHLNETWSFPPLPETSTEFLSAFTKVALRDVTPSGQLTWYPFVASNFDNIRNEKESRVGADVYWRPSSNMQLSATLNPDFGSVESDDVIVNLDAFETYYAEKRAFFLEGQEIFITSPRAGDDGGPSNAGPRSTGSRGQPTTMLNTRRIGASPDYLIPAGVTVNPVDVGRPADLMAAFKLTGQSGNLRYGTLVATEDDSLLRGRDAANNAVRIKAEGRDFLVGRLLYEDTSAGGRRALGWMTTQLTGGASDATVNGVDLHYFSPDARWLLDTQFLHSDVASTSGTGMFFDASFLPARGTQHRFGGEFLGKDLDIDDFGFWRRSDSFGLEYQYKVTDSNLSHVRSKTRSLTFRYYWNEAGEAIRAGIYTDQDWVLNNNQSVGVSFNYFPARVEDQLSRGNGTFKTTERWDGRLAWSSDKAQPLSINVGMNLQQENMGERRLTAALGINWRPIDVFSVQLDVERIDREAWYVHRGGNRINSYETKEWAPKLGVEYFLSAKQQFRVSMQWAGIDASEDRFYTIDQNRTDFLTMISKPTAQSEDFIISRMSFQARYRWELAPLSDLFIVYTRGSNLPRNTLDDTVGLFRSAWTDKIVDTWAIKLRYRLDR